MDDRPRTRISILWWKEKIKFSIIYIFYNIIYFNKVCIDYTLENFSRVAL